MPSELIDKYEIEYQGVRLPDREGWGAYVAVYGPSHNPMHLNSIFPKQHVSIETVFPTEQLAEAEAYRVALDLLQGHQPPRQAQAARNNCQD